MAKCIPQTSPNKLQQSLKALWTFVAFALVLLAAQRASATIYGDSSFQDIDPKSFPAVGIQTLHFESKNDWLEDLVKVSSKTLLEKSLCESDSWSKEVTMGNCSGTKITEDFLLTAAHCVPSGEACKSARWIFPDRALGDYTEDPQGFSQVPKDQIAYCESIVAWSHQPHLDYAIVKIKSTNPNRMALPNADFEPLSPGDELMTVSFPLGTSLKSSTGSVRSVDKNSKVILATLDAMRGSSGAPVFSIKTKKWVGILARGDRDYIGIKDCNEIKVCKEDECRGEEIIPLESILKDLSEKEFLSF